MRAEVYVTSCHRDRPKQQAIRDTWGRALGPWFFLGLGEHPCVTDEVLCAVEDGYDYVVWKTREQCRLALERDLDYVFICDVDTYVNAKALLSYPLESRDYVGHRCGEGHAAGGHGYWLSRRAYGLIAKYEPHAGWADMQVGFELRDHGIEVFHDPGYGDGTITRHLGTGTGHYDPKTMHEEYARR